MATGLFCPFLKAVGLILQAQNLFSGIQREDDAAAFPQTFVFLPDVCLLLESHVIFQRCEVSAGVQKGNICRLTPTPSS